MDSAAVGYTIQVSLRLDRAFPLLPIDSCPVWPPVRRFSRPWPSARLAAHVGVGVGLVSDCPARSGGQPDVRRPAKRAPSAISRSTTCGIGSDHDRAMDLRHRQTVLGDFNDTKFEYQGVTTRFFRRDGKFMVNTEGPDGQVSRLRDQVHVRRAAAAAVHGRVSGRPRAGAARVVGREEQEMVLRHAAGRDRTSGSCRAIRCIGPASAQNWNTTCADCHSTNVHKNYDPEDEHVSHDVAGDQRQLRGVPRAGERARRLGATAGRRSGIATSATACRT